MEAEKITKLFQAVGAALALPAAAAGVYTVYRTNFSPDTACQNLRASIVSTMEKNVGLDAKKALLKKDVEDFNKNCGEVDPAAREMFQAVLEGRASIGDLSAKGQAPARPAAVAAVPPVNQPAAQGMSQPAAAPVQVAPQVGGQVAAPVAMQPAPAPVAPAQPPAQQVPSSYAAPQPPIQAQPPVAAPMAAPMAAPSPAPQPMPAQQARPAAPTVPAKTAQPAATGQAPQLPGQTKVAAKPPSAQQGETRGWVVLARREGIRRAEVYFDGFQFSLTSFPPPGTILTARVAVPILADINPRPERGAPPVTPAPQGTVKQGACVKVLSTRAGIGRLWGEVVSTRC